MSYRRRTRVVENHLGFHAFIALKVVLMTYNSFDSFDHDHQPGKDQQLFWPNFLSYAPTLAGPVAPIHPTAEALALTALP